MNALGAAHLAVAVGQAWVGQDEKLAATCRKALALARDTKDAALAERAAKVCILRPSDDATRAAALVLARRAVDLGKGHLAGDRGRRHPQAARRRPRPSPPSKPLPDEKAPLPADATADDLILWLAYKEAKALSGFEAAPPPAKKCPPRTAR